MACCKCCCGGVDCTEGQQGKCCCGENCCNEDEYCCDGSCVPNPCVNCDELGYCTYRFTGDYDPVTNPDGSKTWEYVSGGCVECVPSEIFGPDPPTCCCQEPAFIGDETYGLEVNEGCVDIADLLYPSQSPLP